MASYDSDGTLLMITANKLEIGAPNTRKLVGSGNIAKPMIVVLKPLEKTQLN